MAGVPNIFANATTQIPLVQLDQNFATNATIGTSTVGLGNTTSSLAGLTSCAVTNGQNAATIYTVTNSNIGTAATAEYDASNGTATYASGILGTGFTTNGVLKANAAFLTGNNAAGVAICATSGSGFIAFAAGSTSENMRLGSDGSFLYGTTTNGGWRTNASVAFQSAAARTLSVYNSSATGDAGDVRVDHTAQNYFNFNFNGSTNTGSIHTTDGTTTTYSNSSDVRLKENIVDAPDSGAIIDAIQVRQFDWKVSGQHSSFAFIAQELNQSLLGTGIAGAVTVGDDDPNIVTKQWGVDPSKLVGLLLKEIQSLRARIAALEAKINI